MEHINMDTEPAVAPGEARWAPYRPRGYFTPGLDVNGFATYFLVPGIRSWLTMYEGGSTSNVNNFMEEDPDSATGVPGVLLKKLGVYSVHCSVFIAEFDSSNRTCREDVLLLGPSLEDNSVVSSQVDTLSLSINVDNYQQTQGYAVVTDLDADNHVYIGVLANFGLPTFTNHVASTNLEITYMGLSDIRFKDG